VEEQSGVKRLAVLGAGSWGTALAIALAPRFDAIRLWSHDPSRARDISEAGENRRYLPGFRLPLQTLVLSDLAATLAEVDLVVSAMPSQHVRHIWLLAAAHTPACTPVLSATKGLEEHTLLRMSEVIAEVAPGLPVAVLSGPTFAREVAAGEPAALVVAATDSSVAHSIQLALATSALRLYASSDVVGVEMGAALKNVIAIGAGICSGLGLGSNSVAALVTRGLAEITRLALRMGGCQRTLSGLAGLGDLVLTATGSLSRNRHVGIELGAGKSLSGILQGMTMVAEGVSTCRAACDLAARYDVELPIIQRMYEVLYEGKHPRAAIRELMERPLTSE
jgi:glycerol-3-phosphate dehydrogenase (NAD(P)+)